VRVTHVPEAEQFYAIFFREWEDGVAAAREMAQARLGLSMLRLSNPVETDSTLALADRQDLVSVAQRGLAALGYARLHTCLLIVGVTGRAASVRAAWRAARSIARRHGGLPTGTYLGSQWAKSRFLSPYLRNSLWEAGYAVDTLETAVPWTEVLPAAQGIQEAIRDAMADTGERVHVFAHLSHLYETGASVYVTTLFRVLPDPDRMLELWQGMKRAASLAVVRHGGTISHQHGVGVDHAPYLAAEKGALGMALIGDAIRRCDPDGIMNPGKLIEEVKPRRAQRDTED
jgi:alkyldihydroxyacetonephosphate synthase